jgi:predicted PurR-regulated permease PerM
VERPVSQSIRITITPQTWLSALGILLLVAIVYFAREALALILLSCVLAAALYPAVEWMKRRNFPKQLSILIFYLVFLFIVLGTGLLLGNMVVEQGHQFLQRFPEYVDVALQRLQLSSMRPTENRVLTLVLQSFGGLVRQAAGFLLSSLDYLGTLLKGALSMIAILAITFFFLLDPRYFEQCLLRVIPCSVREGASQNLRLLVMKIGAYVRGQLMVMLFVGVLVMLGLSLLGVPYAMVLGVLAFALDIIPIIGPLMAAAVGIVVALGESPSLVVGTALIYFAIQQIENYLLYPIVLRRATGVHPFWILIGLMTGGLLFGIVGVMLAIPTVMTLRLLIETVYLPWLNRRES